MDAPGYTRDHGPLLAEEVATLLGERIDAISERTWGRGGARQTDSGGHGAFPFPAGDGAGRLQWLAR
eukprot:7706316-Alexandrium_andersonii.AAC.1